MTTTHRPLTERQRKFCELYAATGNASKAAIGAGYSPASAPTNADKLLKNTNVQAYLQQLTQQVQSDRIATAQERQEFWTSVMRGTLTVKVKGPDGKEGGYEQSVDVQHRLKASELLSKAQGEQVEKHVVTGANGGPVQTMALSPDDLEGLDAQALARLYFGGKG